MERIDEEAVVDLGVASEETRGDGVATIENGGRLPFMTGLAADD